jgi:triacylglycerol lipase
MPTIVFLHGLNTFGDDLLHVGPVTFGMMHDRLLAAFAKRGIEFIPVTALGAGSPEQQAERALRFLQSKRLIDSPTPMHLLGHSTGGLVARVLAASPELKDRIKTVFTLGTPHQGTDAAHFGVAFSERHPVLRRLFAAFGYDTLKKHEIFGHFTPEAMQEFNRRFPLPANMRLVSLLCEVDGDDLSWPLAALQSRLVPAITVGEARSDGFILSKSQLIGERLGPFKLDHFGELGFFFQTRSLARASGRREFDRLVDTLVERVSL